MKKRLLYLAMLSCVGVLIFATVLPAVTLMGCENNKINETLFWIFTATLCACVAIIFTACTTMLRYVDIINDLDKEQRRLEEANFNTTVLNAKLITKIMTYGEEEKKT